MAANRPIRSLNRYYKSNPAFRQWVKANEAWFQENPEVFEQLLRNPNMVNLFMDLMVVDSSRIQQKLNRMKKRKR